MELQELVVRVATSQLRFRLAPRFADVRGSFIEELQETYDLTEYGWGEAALQVSNKDQTTVLVVGSRELRVVVEHLERVDDYVAMASSFFARGLEVLGIKEIEFLGVRTFWMAAVDSFEELVQWMAERLSPDEPFTAAISSKLTDVGWVFEYKGKDPKHSVRLGPMKVEQALEQFLATDKRELFPDSFLFVDFDRVYNDSTIPVSEVVQKWSDSFGKNLEIGTRFGAAFSK